MPDETASGKRIEVGTSSKFPNIGRVLVPGDPRAKSVAAAFRGQFVPYYLLNNEYRPSVFAVKGDVAASVQFRPIDNGTGMRVLVRPHAGIERVECDFTTCRFSVPLVSSRVLRKALTVFLLTPCEKHEADRAKKLLEQLIEDERPGGKWRRCDE